MNGAVQAMLIKLFRQDMTRIFDEDHTPVGPPPRAERGELACHAEGVVGAPSADGHEQAQAHSWIEAKARLTFLIFSLSLASAVADEKQLSPTTYHPQPVLALSSAVAGEKPTCAVLSFDATFREKGRA